MKFLLLIVCLVPLVSAKPIEGETKKCFANYLKNQGIDVQGVESDEAVTATCKFIATTTKELSIGQLRERLAADGFLKDIIDCVVDSLQALGIGNLILQQAIYSTEDDSEDDEYVATREALQLKVSEVSMISLSRCTIAKGLRFEFDKLFDEDNTKETQELPPKEDYCVRKQIIDNDLLTADNAELPLNPNNVDTTDIDCEALFKETVKKSEDQNVEEILKGNQPEGEENFELIQARACLLQMIREDDVIANTFQFDYVKELNLNEEDKNLMREDFVKIMTKVIEKSMKCVTKHLQ